MNVTLSPDSAGDQFRLPNIVRGIGQASGLSNMLRNLGGAVETATLATVLTKREQYHSNVIGQSVTLYRDEVRQGIRDMTAFFWRTERRTQLLPSTRRSWRSPGWSNGRR